VPGAHFQFNILESEATSLLDVGRWTFDVGRSFSYKMTGPKGPWEESGNQEFCIVSPEFTRNLHICGYVLVDATQ
jgi:hypothetical protein